MTTKEVFESLKICASKESGCYGCVFYGHGCADCITRLTAEAANTMEALAAELEAERYRHDRYVDFELAEAAELAKVKAERDAAIADIKIAWLCAVCKNRVIGREWLLCQSRNFMEQADGTLTCDSFEWRGVNPNAD